MTCNCLESGQLLERNGHTATCNRLTRKLLSKEQRQKLVVKELRKVSPKMAKALQEYSKKKKAWLVGKKCAVFPYLDAIEPHHQRGKATIELLLDETWWLPVSREGHLKIEANVAWAKSMGFTLSRLEKKPISNETV